MLTRKIPCLAFISLGATLWLGILSASAQTSTPEFYNNLLKKVAFVDADLTALGQGQAIVKLVPPTDKREVAVAGLVSLPVPAELFLQSFREGMLGKNNPAMLETGRFGAVPTVDDFAALSFEDRELDDLKDCVVGNCKLKLSAMMIERFRKEIDWSSHDYRFQATRLLKQILVDYVRDYLIRGDDALIEYNDKPSQVRLADEQRALMAASSLLCDAFAEFPQSSLGSKLQLIENNVVWSKIKFGLKPVLAINHISIYQREQKAGSQILIVSKQIYANHYFDSSLSLSVFGNHPNAASTGYLFYQNRSRADGLQGPFAKLKRGLVENRAINSLTAILEQSKADLAARGLNHVESTPVPGKEPGWKRWTVRGVYLLSLFAVALVIVFLAVRNNPWRRSLKAAQRHP